LKVWNKYNIDEIKRRIEYCIDTIYINDSDLFIRNNYEVTISTKLAQYLFVEFRNYDVDCEYNKHFDGRKIVEELDAEVRPDIVIHKRGIDKDNLVCIEIKKEQNSSNRGYDYQKIEMLTKLYGKFKYKLGVFIDFAVNKEDLRIVYFENGIEQPLVSIT